MKLQEKVANAHIYKVHYLKCKLYFFFKFSPLLTLASYLVKYISKILRNAQESQGLQKETLLVNLLVFNPI
jgi:hypothetical protein